MRILLLFPCSDGQTGPGICRAFQNLGHTVKAVDAKLNFANSFNATKSNFVPDLVFCSRTPELTNEVKKIKQAYPNALACVYNVDSRPFGFWKYLYPLIQACDYHFVVDYNYLDKWRKEVHPKTFWLPQGLQDEVYDKPKEITQADIDKYTCDVSFCGGQGVVYGNRASFLGNLHKQEFSYKHWGGAKENLWNESHNKCVSLSKISLGCSGCVENGRTISVRNFKVLGAQGFLLERYGDGLNDVIPCEGNNRVMDYYTSPEDLLLKIRYWLKHEDERKAIAKRGYKFAHKNTYKHRMKNALEIMKLT